MLVDSSLISLCWWILFLSLGVGGFFFCLLVLVEVSGNVGGGIEGCVVQVEVDDAVRIGAGVSEALPGVAGGERLFWVFDYFGRLVGGDGAWSQLAAGVAGAGESREVGAFDHAREVALDD